MPKLCQISKVKQMLTYQIHPAGLRCPCRQHEQQVTVIPVFIHTWKKKSACVQATNTSPEKSPNTNIQWYFYLFSFMITSTTDLWRQFNVLSLLDIRHCRKILCIDIIMNIIIIYTGVQTWASAADHLLPSQSVRCCLYQFNNNVPTCPPSECPIFISGVMFIFNVLCPLSSAQTNLASFTLVVSIPTIPTATYYWSSVVFTYIITFEVDIYIVPLQWLDPSKSKLQSIHKGQQGLPALVEDQHISVKTRQLQHFTTGHFLKQTNNFTAQ